MAFLDGDKLSYEIFSILESKFLFPLYTSGSTSPCTPPAPLPPASAGRVRILSIDGGGSPSEGLLAAAALARMESALRRGAGDPSACVADFFDVAAGSGVGGVLAAMLFTRGHDGRPLFSADDALRLLLAESRRRRGGGFASDGRTILRGMFRRSGGLFRRLFGDSTLRDTLKPVLIPCFDLTTGASFVFSRADAVEADAYDFLIREVCAATCANAGAAVELRSLDGRTRVAAVGGGVALANPAAAAITHVLNNKQEFPFAVGVEDLMVVSLGTSGCKAASGTAELVRIAGEGASDMVDQAVSMAFGHNRANNYIRIQANGFMSGNCTPKMTNCSKLMEGIENVLLSHRNVESLLFRGKKISEQTNAEKLERFAEELIKEEKKRKKNSIPTVVLKQVMSPRTSSATTATTFTTMTTTSTVSSS
ncbi:patatin-like protein 3 [Canna indica]|uniref:Patatin n=1 Tax=Canna indica TaxID=4628 RepID=A0AAQ3QD10_9LILI|nr:patatin-like protein 3 [Canna indica]